jgi:hypothetical protein
MMTRQYSIKLAQNIVLGLLVAGALSYPLDWLVWTLRHEPTDTITVEHYTVAEQKANKEGWYPDGSADVTCSRSLFGETGGGSCWWLRRHSQLIDRY